MTFARVALALEQQCALETVCKAIANGTLAVDSSSVGRRLAIEGIQGIDDHLESLLEAWNAVGSGLTAGSLVVLLMTANEVISVARHHSPKPQVVWTGPRVDGSFPRSTREVIRELIRDAKRDLLIVGYWIVAYEGGDGIIEEFIRSLASATENGVSITMVFDERTRPNGLDNQTIIRSLWPRELRLPALYTWRLPENAPHLKLHAKLVVKDRNDALITSANFTSYAMDNNIELGIRLFGSQAAEIYNHIKLLIASGVLYPDNESIDSD